MGVGRSETQRGRRSGWDVNLDGARLPIHRNACFRIGDDSCDQTRRASVNRGDPVGPIRSLSTDGATVMERKHRTYLRRPPSIPSVPAVRLGRPAPPEGSLIQPVIDRGVAPPATYSIACSAWFRVGNLLDPMR